MNVLIANDDGIDARGLRELVMALSEVADVYVFAPDGQRSAFSHSITTGRKITGARTEVPGAKLAYALSGTPADCVKLGCRFLRARGIELDMVFAGINHGSNLGTDTIYSGTVGAAVEGNICGLPAVAVSVGSHQASHFDYACELAVNTIKKAADKISPDTVININVPDVPKEEVKGVRYTVLGARDYNEYFSAEDAMKDTIEYQYSGAPLMYEGLPEILDVISDQKGYATITPLQRDMTCYGKMEDLRSWGIDE